MKNCNRPKSESQEAKARAAEAYAERGWAVFPLEPNGKRPLVIHGHKEASKDIARIRQWWEKWPDANIGLACAASGIYAVDLDRKDDKDGPGQWERLAKQHGFPSNGTLTNLTPNGRHLLYAHHEPLPNTASKLAPGVDTRGPGYIVAPPSVVNGVAYRWENEGAPLLPLPSQVAALVMSPQVAALVPPESPNLKAMLRQANAAECPPVAPRWLVRHVIECDTLTLLTAAPGSMKSFLMLDMAVCVAAGIPWLNERAVRPCPVLWVNTNNSEAVHRARLGALLRGHGLPNAPLFHVTIFDLSLSNPAHVQAIEDAANDVQAALVVVDTLSGTLLGVEENAAKEMTIPAAHMRALAGDGRAVVFIHHPAKNDPAGARGSGVLIGKVDNHLILTRDKDSDLLKLEAGKVRGGGFVPVVAQGFLGYVPVDEGEALHDARFVSGTLAPQKENAADEKILRALATGEKTTNELREETNLSHKVLTDRLNILTQQKKITVTKGQRNAKVYALSTPVI